MSEREVCLVTGGGGFVGKALCKKLRSEGAIVRSLSRGAYPELDDLGVSQFSHDLSSSSLIPASVLEGVTTVFHTAAKVSMWGRYEDFYAANVLGTRKLIEQAMEAGARKFIYTSSPSVIASGADLRGINEDVPYPKHFDAGYPETKSIAEDEVLRLNSDTFFTCALRPHLIFGPGDTNLIPAVITKGKAGALKIIGSGENLVDFTYIDDCVSAHLCASRALDENVDARGRAYFISQDDPYPLWTFINQVLEANGIPPVTTKVRKKTALRASRALEAIHRLLPILGEPRLTKFLVSEMATDHYFDISRAKDLLGYQPSMTVAEGLQRTFGDYSADGGFKQAANLH